MAATSVYRCHCGRDFTARVADRNRGWARFCSKSCKAKEQEKRTHQYASFKRVDDDFDLDFEGGGWDAHKEVF